MLRDSRRITLTVAFLTLLPLAGCGGGDSDNKNAAVGGSATGGVTSQAGSSTTSAGTNNGGSSTAPTSTSTTGGAGVSSSSSTPTGGATTVGTGNTAGASSNIGGATSVGGTGTSGSAPGGTSAAGGGTAFTGGNSAVGGNSTAPGGATGVGGLSTGGASTTSAGASGIGGVSAVTGGAGSTVVSGGVATTGGASSTVVSGGVSTTGGASAATGGVSAATGGVSAATGGAPVTTGGAPGGAPAATGGAVGTGGVTSVCTTSALRCNGNALEVCSASHQWMTQQICSQSCDSSGATPQCVNAIACAPGGRRCATNLSQVCNSTGTAWLTAQVCPATCSAGLCTGQCTPGEERCDGNIPQTCDTSGTAWTSGTACTGTCNKGACSEPGLVIDADANATLDGEHYYDGDVVLKNASVLTSNTGRLIIHANAVTVDATSKIVIAPTGDDPRGRGQDGIASTYCSSAGTYYTISASGAGFGTQGETKTSCGYYYSTCYCSTSRIGGGVYGIADDEVATGSSGGKCDTTPGGKGGGYLAIYANTIVVQGQVTALGAAGTSCAGGGSGGSVLLRANTLTFTGAISTAGAAGGTSGGKGGDGVVKLLYGGTNTLTGTVIGTKFASFMPPFDVSCATHPRQDRWYNDAFASVDLAWSKPFSNGAGYYDKLNTTYGFVPSPATSDYLSSESISFPSSSLADGAVNYLHIDTLGPFANVGTVETRYAVRVNGTPPNVYSSSHPSSTTWYTNASPYLSWALPVAPGMSTAIPDDNISGFYWVWDHFQETIPTTADNYIPMDLTTPQNSKQLLLPGNANGIWFFHIIAKDTMGYLTKIGTTFRVQIGTAPATMGSVSGSVTNASTSAFMSGVTVTLNRGVLTGTTTSSGSYAIQNVVPGTYEIRARATGFTDSMTTVTIIGGQTSTANFTMAPSP